MVPQIIVIVLFTLEIGFILSKHGQPKEGKYNIGTAIISTIIWIIILYYGGFWKPILN